MALNEVVNERKNDFEENTSKEYRNFATMIFLIAVIMIGINIMNDGKEEAIAINFIFGLPLFFIILGFVRGLNKSPIEITLEGTRIIITFWEDRKDEVMLNEINSATVHIHSKRTAFLELKYDDMNGKSKVIKCWKKYHENFTDFTQQLLIRIDDTEKALVYIGNESGSTRELYNLNVPWMVFLENKRNFSSLFDELKNESLLKKIGALIVFVLLFVLKAGVSSKKEFIIFGWILSVGYIMYLLVGAILRVSGYSRKESIGIFFSGLFFVFLGFGSVCIIVMTLIERLS